MASNVQMYFKDLQGTVFNINLHPIFETVGVTFSEKKVQKLSLARVITIHNSTLKVPIST